MKIEYTKTLTNFFIIVLLTTSCNDVLDEAPDNRTTIDESSKIGELLVGAYPGAGYPSFLEPMSDNAGDKGPDAIISVVPHEINAKSYFWEDIILDDVDSPSNYWNNAYKAISQANQALQSIEELGDGEDLNAYKGEALLCRAYAHFMLVYIFSKAYNPNTSGKDLGIPYVTKPGTVLLGDFTRGTVQEVYDKIQADLEEGLPLIQDNYQVKTFHFTKKAAAAFASRFYLSLGKWDKVITYSTQALGGSGVGVLREWANNYRNLTYQEQQILFRSSTKEPANLLLVTANSLYARNFATARYQLSEQLKNIIFPFINATYSPWAYNIYGISSLYYNIPIYEEYFKITNEAAGAGIPFVTYVLFSTDEAILNRAEAYAMLEQYDNALADINLSYAVKSDNSFSPFIELTHNDIKERFAVSNPNQYTPFYPIPSEALPYINAVLTCKRTVFYNQGLRWFDIKRLDMEVIHTDVNNNVYELPKSDNRRAVQIPESASAFGIEKNPR